MDKVPIFANLGKTTNDFFSKGFPAAHKVELSTASANGLTFVSSAERKTRKGEGDYILGKVEAKYKGSYNSNNVELTGTVDTDGLFKGDVSVVPASVSNLKLLVKPQGGKSTEVATGFEFQNQNLSSTSTLLWKPTGVLTFTETLVVRAGKGVSVGAESVYAVRRASQAVPAGLDSAKVLVNVKRDPTLEFSVFAKQTYVETKDDQVTPAPKLTVGGLYEHKATDATTLHSTFDWDTSKSVVPAAFKVQFGASYKVDADTSVQGKLDQDGLLTVHVAKQLTPHIKGTVTTDFNTLDLASSSHKLAVGVIYK
jgi:hypothetical protein